MNEYLILIAANHKRDLTSEEEKYCLSEYAKWSEEIGKNHISARRLVLNEGKLLPSKKKLITDGPFIEAKELIAGFILINANSMEHACQLAESCPLRAFFQLFVKETR